MGTASCRWVLPVFTMPRFFSSRVSSVQIKPLTAGSSCSSSASTAAICSAEGKVSLEDWLRFTSSFGWQSLSPASSFTRLAITSLTFMFVCVPEPVCHTTNGKCSFSFPVATSSAACSISLHFSSVIFSGISCRLALAAAFFRIPNARMISSGIVSCPTPMGKLMRLRSV